MSDEAASLRAAMVETLARYGSFRSERIREAFLAVPRHLFVPGVSLERAYSDESIATRCDERRTATSSSSQPGVMAVMLDQLQPDAGQRWLEIGAGTGYNAALIAWLVGPRGAVTTIDIQEDVAGEAADRLAAAGYGDVRVTAGDGWLGVPERSPFDRIVVTAASNDVSPQWVAQLAGDGLLLLPLQLARSHALVCFRKADGCLVSESIRPSGFIPLRGHEAAPARWPVTLVCRPWSLSVPADLDVSVRTIAQLLSDPPRVGAPAPLPPDAWACLEFEPHVVGVTLFQQRDPARENIRRRLAGILDPDPLGLAVSDDEQLVAFGAPAAEERLRALAALPREAWRIEAVPRDRDIDIARARVLEREHHRFVARTG